MCVCVCAHAVVVFSFEICPSTNCRIVRTFASHTHAPNRRPPEKEEASNFKLESDKTTGHIVCHELNILRLRAERKKDYIHLLAYNMSFLFVQSAATSWNSAVAVSYFSRDAFNMMCMCVRARMCGKAVFGMFPSAGI